MKGAALCIASSPAFDLKLRTGDGKQKIQGVMTDDPMPFDSVLFWDMAGERHMKVPGERPIRDASLIPLPGDRVTFDNDEEQFSVVNREFKYNAGTCFVMVNVQPVARDKTHGSLSGDNES